VVTDGEHNKYLKPGAPIPEGWRRGTAAKIYITDGKQTKELGIGKPIPDGWRPGSMPRYAHRITYEGVVYSQSALAQRLATEFHRSKRLVQDWLMKYDHDVARVITHATGEDRRRTCPICKREFVPRTKTGIVGSQPCKTEWGRRRMRARHPLQHTLSALRELSTELGIIVPPGISGASPNHK
jgi:hypothetical protein